MLSLHLPVEVHLTTFLILALYEGKWLASYSGHITPKDRALSTHRMGGWVRSRASMDMLEKNRTSDWNWTHHRAHNQLLYGLSYQNS